MGLEERCGLGPYGILRTMVSGQILKESERVRHLNLHYELMAFKN